MRSHSLALPGRARQTCNVLHIHTIDLDNFSTRRDAGNDAHCSARDAERIGQKVDERFVCRSVHRRRGKSDLECVAVQTDDLAPRRTWLYANAEAEGCATLGDAKIG
jgi:hypothetical protein